MSRFGNRLDAVNLEIEIKVGRRASRIQRPNAACRGGKRLDGNHAGSRTLNRSLHATLGQEVNSLVKSQRIVTGAGPRDASRDKAAIGQIGRSDGSIKRTNREITKDGITESGHCVAFVVSQRQSS